MNYLHNYSMFESIEKLNESINDHIKRNQYELNETDRDIFLMLGRYSVKYKGVSHLKADTIATAIGKSKRTVQRSIRKLERLGMVERCEFIREKSGGNGANIYRILPYKSTNDTAELSPRLESDKPTQTSVKDSDKQNETINFKSLLKNNTNDNSIHNRNIDEVSEEKLIDESIRNNTPAEIINLLSPFFYGSELYKYLGILFKAKYRPHINIRIEDHIDEYKACIYDVMKRYKLRKIKSLEGYLFASIKALTRRLFIENIATAG